MKGLFDKTFGRFRLLARRMAVKHPSAIQLCGDAAEVPG